MKKEPTKKQITQIFLFGLGTMSLGIWLFWLPFIGFSLMLFGGFMVLTATATIVVKMLK